MKRLRVLGFLLLALHLGAVWGLKICFQDFQEAHAHTHDDAHQNDTPPETEQPDSFHCAETPYLMAFNGRSVGVPTYNGSLIAATYDIALNPGVAAKNNLSESPPPVPPGLPPYLVFSVLRI